MDLCAAFDRFGKELRDAKREGRKPRRQFGAPRFKSRRRATPAFALWNDQFAVTNHFRFDARPRATMRVPLLGEMRLREAVPGVGGILGCRVSERRGRWYASFQFDTDWNDGERSDEAEARMACFAYIEGFYNPLRLHSGLGYRSPIDYERTFHHDQVSPMNSLPEQVH